MTQSYDILSVEEKDEQVRRASLITDEVLSEEVGHNLEIITDCELLMRGCLPLGFSEALMGISIESGGCMYEHPDDGVLSPEDILIAEESLEQEDEWEEVEPLPRPIPIVSMASSIVNPMDYDPDYYAEVDIQLYGSAPHGSISKGWRSGRGKRPKVSG